MQTVNAVVPLMFSLSTVFANKLRVISSLGVFFKRSFQVESDKYVEATGGGEYSNYDVNTVLLLLECHRMALRQNDSSDACPSANACTAC